MIRNKRRHIFYIDRLFQKKLMVLFLGLNFVIVVANILYYFIHLKGAVEDNLFRSHIVIDNISQVIADDVLWFNVVVAGGTLILTMIFYFASRMRLRAFFYGTKKALSLRMGKGTKEDQPPVILKEFQEIDQVLENFFRCCDTQLEKQEKRTFTLKEQILQK
ncbi:MAG: hypothetical protein GY765_24460 [bacterium]|nr:hypothetical protein [bacterium]